jgi:serine/threonine-protein kinase
VSQPAEIDDPSAPSSSSSELQGAPSLGTVLAGCYRLTRFLGQGGMGAVYEAESASGRRVAVKVLLDGVLREGGTDLLERFYREVGVTESLGSPHIVTVLDSGVSSSGTPFMVMPLMVGMDLEALLERVGALHPAVAVRIARQACAALAVAHEAGIVHRDIKPANLFLDHDKDGVVIVRVLDFGVAKLRSARHTLTRTGSHLGTPLYMAPEQIVDVKRVDERSDVWSIALTLYEALAGGLPFHEATSIQELFSAISSRDITWVQDLAPWIDPALAVVLHGALLRDRERRCPSVEDFAAALRPFADGCDDITCFMLDPVTDEIAASVAPRTEPPTSWRAVAPQKALPGLTLSDRDPFLGRTLAERYTLLRRLGAGGMGTVYEASLPDGGRVAVKVIRPELAGPNLAARRRFVREARAAASIDNPHVVRVLEVGSDAEGIPFIAMELLHGSDLQHVVKQLGALAPRTTARLFWQACDGLRAAHARGFVHRDVKPANLFLHRQPSGEVVVKLCDFGVVKQLDADGEADTTANLTHTGGVIGSPMYMSPEQATNAKTIDPRADVWSLGAALYETLTGVPPWHGKESMGELIVAVCTEPLPHLQDRAPWVPPELAAAVHRAMTRNVGRRFQSMTEFGEVLRTCAGRRTIVSEIELRALSEAKRGRACPRVALDGDSAPSQETHAPPTAASERLALSHTLAETRAAPRGAPRRRWPLVSAAIVTLLTAASLALVQPWSRQGSAPTPSRLTASVPEPARAPLAEPSSEAAPAPREVHVTVTPSSATARVNGEVRELEDGALVLRGAPGDTFVVELRDGRRHLERRVAITREGVPDPPRLDLTSSPGPRTQPTRPSSAQTAVPAPAHPPQPAPRLSGRDAW